MRILELTIEGFGPFAAEHTIDFASFSDSGVYLIAGATGAGKSSILDAIVFALYGSVPRYTGMTQKRANLRSDFAGPATATRVELTFSSGGERYRVRRTPEYERPKLRGSGTTVAKSSVALDHAIGDGWETLTTGWQDAAARLDEIVGLRREQFQQVILLAQGRFAEFLQADSETRAEILRQLFGTQRFAQLTQRLVHEARESDALRLDLERQLSACAARAADALPEPVEAEEPQSVADALAAGRRLAQERITRAEAARATRDAASTSAAAARRLLADLAERDAAQRALDAANEAAAAIESERERLDGADRASDAWSALTAHDAAVEAEAAAVSRHAAAAAALEEADARIDADRLAQELRDEVAALAAAAEEEARMPALLEAVATAAEALESCERRLQSLQERRTTLPEAIAEADARIGELQQAADAAPRHEDDLEQAEAAVARLRRLRDAEGEHDRAARAARAALEERTAASLRAERLLRALLDGAAARLARTLEPETPCPVCGGLDHPSPAQPADDATANEASVEAAHEAERAAGERLDAAREQERAAAREVEALREGLTSTDETALQRAVAQAREALDQAKQANARLQEAQGARAELEQELLALQDRIDAEQALRAARVSEHRVAVTEQQRVDALVHAARAGADTVADRRAEQAERLARVDELRAAAERLAESTTAAERAAAALAEALDRCEISDEAALRALHLERPERERMRQRVREHEEAVARATAVLERPSVQSIGERLRHGQPDLEALEADEQRSEQEHQRLVGEAAAAEEVVRQIEREQAEEQRLRQRLERLGDHALALTRLAQTLEGRGPNARRMRLETYVLAAGLESILDAANQRLQTMTEGRYTLLHDDAEGDRGKRGGLGIVVLDDFTGAARAVQSLSGGETFLTSLALALGLADVVQEEAGGVQLDTLFIDEGFGALDAEVLELAMQTLSELQVGGRSIGVISHVQSMQERLPERIRVVRRAGGQGSRIIS